MNLSTTKLIASLAAITTVVTSLAPVFTLTVKADDAENGEAVNWGYDNGLTMYSDLNSFNPNGLITRAQIAKFMVAGADALGLSLESDQECDFNDLNTADQSLVSYIEDACAMGLVKAQSNYRPNDTVTRTELEILFARMAFGGVDEVLAYADDNGLTEAMAAREMLMDGGIITQEVAGNTLTKRLRPMLMLYRMADMDMPEECTEGVDCQNDLPGTGSNDTGTVVEVKNGNLELSLGGQSPANNSSVPIGGVATFAQINFVAGSADVNVHSVTFRRGGLGDRSDINRVYFEKNGVRVSSRSTVGSDEMATLSFSPDLVVKAGSTMSLDLVASLTGTTPGSEHNFTATSVNSSAQSATFNVTTPTLRTANYTVSSVTVETGGQATSIQGSETNYEIGRFRLTNNSNDKAVMVKAITMRNSGNGDLADGLMDIGLYKNSTKVSTDVIINGRDVTFVLAPNTDLTAGENSLFYVKASTRTVENAAGDTYTLQFKNTEDVNIVEKVTMFRTTIQGFTSNLTLPTYTVNGGDVMLATNSGTPTVATVSPGMNNVVLARGTVTARQAVTLEDLAFTYNGSTAASGAIQRMTLRIGNTTSSFTPSNTNGTSFSDTFDGAFTVNGSVPFEITADIKTNFSGSASFNLSPIAITDFSRVEYVANGNTVDANQKIGTLSTVNVSIQASNISVSRNDTLTDRTIVKGSNNLLVFGANISTSTDSTITINSIDFTSGSSMSTGLANKVYLTLYVNGVAKSQKTWNDAALTRSSLGFNVTRNAPVAVQIKANINNETAVEGKILNIKMLNISATDSNSQTVAAPSAVSSVALTIAGAGRATVADNASSTDQGFAVASTVKKIGSFSVQAINDDLQLRGIYLTLSGVNGATNAGNIVSNVVIKDTAGNVVATESSRSGTNNEIVKFDSFLNGGVSVMANSSPTFNVYGTIGTLNSSTDGGELVAKINTSYTDSNFSGQIFSGVRLFSTSVGSYVTSGTVTANSIGNVLNVVSAYPLVTKTAGGNQNDLIQFRVHNAGTTSLLVSGFTYFANAQSGGDLNGKAFKVFNGTTVLSTGTLTIGADTFLAFNVLTPVTIAASGDLVLTVKLDTAFTNTASTPVAGNRIFQLSNVNYAQMFANGNIGSYADVSAGYLTTIGLPISATEIN